MMTVHDDLDDAWVASVDALLDATRVENTVAIGKADAALKAFERTVFDAGYDSNTSGKYVSNVVTRLRRLLAACEGGT